MDLFRKYRSPLGYFMDDEEKRKDSYGVDHSGFSTRDELEYQTARSERENELIQNYNNQGITKDYPQQGTNFWGNPENNYGFGNSNISANIESRKQNQTSVAPQQNQMQNSFAFGNNNQNQMMTNNNSQAKQTPSNSLSGNNNGLNSNFNNNANNNPYAKLKQWLGQSEQNINSALYPKPLGDDANSYQLAQNNKTNTGNLTRTDVNFDDNSLKERMIPVIKDKEKPLDYIYIDTTWNKTTGAGANVDDWNTFNKVNWELNGRSATEEEKRATFDYFDKITSKGKQNVDEKGKLLEKNNNQADFYRNKSQLRISSNETDRLLRNHITEDIKYLQKEFPDFASYPPELQNVLLDIKFNTGNVSQENWPKLRKAIAEKNVFGDEGILKNVHRKDVGKDRNDWAEQQIRNILYWQ